MFCAIIALTLFFLIIAKHLQKHNLVPQMSSSLLECKLLQYARPTDCFPQISKLLLNQELVLHATFYVSGAPAHEDLSPTLPNIFVLIDLMLNSSRAKNKYEK